jgi:hypothetical protein
MAENLPWKSPTVTRARDGRSAALHTMAVPRRRKGQLGRMPLTTRFVSGDARSVARRHDRRAGGLTAWMIAA